MKKRIKVPQYLIERYNTEFFEDVVEMFVLVAPDAEINDKELWEALVSIRDAEPYVPHSNDLKSKIGNF